jgi:PAS domain S-box-containing protein
MLDDRAAPPIEAWLLDSLDRIRLAVEGAEQPDALLGRVLEAALDIFAADRAWLLFPCDPAAEDWQIALERRKPDARSITEDAPALTRSVLQQLVSVVHGAVEPLPCSDLLPTGASRAYAVAVRARGANPYLLTIEHLGRLEHGAPEPLWSSVHSRMLTEVARRISDALTALLAIRKLEDNQRKMEAAERMAHLGYWDRDFINQSITGSREALRMFGLDTDDSTSLKRWQNIWSGLIHPADRGRVRNAMESAIAGGPQYDIVYRIVRSDGEERVVHSRGDITRDEGGRPLYMFGIMQDVTEQKQLEEQLRHAQKMEAIGRLAGGIAHDFNNLLTVINGYAELAMTQVNLDKDGTQLLREIRQAGDRAAGLTRQLLAFSRRQLLEPRIVDVNALLEELRRLLRRLIGEHIELDLLPAKALWPVKVDPRQFEQAVINLAVNARDAMPEGGRLTIQTSNVDLDPAALDPGAGLKHGRYVRVSVRDTGHGMDPTTRAQAFEPFFTTKPVGQGTGLGLAMVYGFVKQSGGHVHVESAPGETVFDLYLPRTDEAPDPQVVEQAPVTERARAPATILVAEDGSAVRRLCKMTLESHGYTVLEASDGHEAAERAKTYSGAIDLLLTDLVMPRMGGAALVDELRRQRPELRVLLMSGYIDEPELPARTTAPIGFIAKPFSPAALLAKIRELLDARVVTAQ